MKKKIQVLLLYQIICRFSPFSIAFSSLFFLHFVTITGIASSDYSSSPPPHNATLLYLPLPLFILILFHSHSHMCLLQALSSPLSYSCASKHTKIHVNNLKQILNELRNQPKQNKTKQLTPEKHII